VAATGKDTYIFVVRQLKCFSWYKLYIKLPSFAKSVTVFTAYITFLRKELVGEFECEGYIYFYCTPTEMFQWI
jgi:hypothetical protein